ncbi:MAG TPA: rhomboid family intramembrane serine protease [Candidatus Sulfotelmatobacter sp.]|nr:rhomboid family intramembrane serine protease [Candidatus Sulfotelmatobacter sp.]
MLEDRYYMRQNPFDSRRSATMALIILNVVVFVLECVLYGYPPRFSQHNPLALSTAGLMHGYVWQLLSFQFLHAGLLHLLFNCWALYMFGREIEETLGLKRFLTLYFASGIFGGLIQATAGFLLGGNFAAPVVGASAGVFGLVAAFAVLYPERPLMLLLFFIIPVSMRAKFLLLISALLAIFGILFPAGNMADAAHLGGMLTGVVFIKYALHWNWRWPQFSRARDTAPRLVKISAANAGLRSRKSSAPDDLPPDEFLSKEVDPILDKISAHGIQSLTERERRILQAAREKMAKR